VSTWSRKNYRAGFAARRGRRIFRGVATVVAKLFNLVLPDCLRVGREGRPAVARAAAQWCATINFPVEIIPGPTVREPTGWR
jgi:pantoate--beta-alanine ligase